MKIKIEVKQDHINKGIKEDCSRCPIALAMLSKGFEHPKADTLHVSYGPYLHQGREYRFIPRSASRFIKSFDDGKPVKPFNFFLEAR